MKFNSFSGFKMTLSKYNQWIIFTYNIYGYLTEILNKIHINYKLKEIDKRYHKCTLSVNLSGARIDLYYSDP